MHAFYNVFHIHTWINYTSTYKTLGIDPDHKRNEVIGQPGLKVTSPSFLGNAMQQIFNVVFAEIAFELRL